MMRIFTTIAILFSSLLILSVIGCQQTCDEPYKLIDGVCCTDENGNQVCDLDELPEAEPEETDEKDDFAMQEAVYDDPLEYEEPEYRPLADEEPDVETESEVGAEPEPEPKEVKATPTIDTSFDVKKTTDAKASGYEPAKPDYQMDFKVEDVNFFYGQISRATFTITNNMDLKVDPEVNIYALSDEKYRKVETVFLKTVKPGETRVFKDRWIGIDVDYVDQTVKFELAFHTPQTGSVVVNAQEVEITKR